MTTGISGGPIYTSASGHYRCSNLPGQDLVFSGYKKGEVETIWNTSTTPFFKRRVARGELLPHTSYYKATKQVVECSTRFSFTHTGTNQNCYNVSTDVIESVPVPSSFPVTPQPDALLKQLSQRAASTFFTKNSFDAGTFLAESRELKRLYTSCAQLFRTLAMKGISKSDTIEEFVSIWLTFRYGLRPLIAELENFEKALERSRARGAERKSFDRAKASQTDQFTFEDPWSTYTTGQFEMRKRWVHTVLREAAFNISGEINPTFVLIDFAKTAWEYQRLSFVLDWFWTVGAWLDAMRLQMSGLKTESSFNERLTVESVLTHESISPIGLYRGYSATSAIYKSVTLRRTPTGVVMDTPAATTQDISAGKIVDMVALVLQSIIAKAYRKWGKIPFATPYVGFGYK